MSASSCRSSSINVQPLRRRSSRTGSRAPGRRRAGWPASGGSGSGASSVSRRYCSERLEAARRPQRRFSLLGLLRQPRAHRQHVGVESEQVPGAAFLTNVSTSSSSDGRAEDVHLVDDDDDLLAPVADGGEEEPLRLGERPIGRGDEEDQVRAGHELGGEPLVLADDRVGAGRVDDVDVAQQLDRRASPRCETVWTGPTGHGVAVLSAAGSAPLSA